MRAIHRDILIACAPIAAGLGLAALVHKAESPRVPASVTTVTHGAGQKA